jgi:aspartyl protease family protein
VVATRAERKTRFQLTGEVIEIRRGADGHYHWPGRIDGRDVDFLIDTGATRTAISTTLARELRLPPVGSVQSQTAGGVVTGQVVRADLELQGGVRASQLRIVALPGLGDRPLLGMDVLGRLRWQQHDGVLRIDLRGAP